MIKSQILDNMRKMKGKIPTVEKNGVEIRKITVFEDVVLRNIDNLNTTALEINGNTFTYEEFFAETEKYMTAFIKMGLKEHDVVSLCLPVSVEFICSYYALTTLGIACNALNIMFLLSQGAKPYLDERCSKVLICYDKYYDMLLNAGSFEGSKLTTVVLTGDETYAHIISDSDKVKHPKRGLPNAEMITIDDFLDIDEENRILSPAAYDESRISTLNYTSGTTGVPKCMAHSDLAPLFLSAAHDYIKRDERRGDRTLLTIPMQHPTGLFYSMVLQMAQGKTLVLEPRYDKRLFAQDIKTLRINHAVQAKPFYAQLISDRAEGRLRPGDFELFRNPYSGGEGIPLAVCKKINETLAWAGCKTPLFLGYGRSEEGSLTVTPYNMPERENTVGVPLTGIKARLAEPSTLRNIPLSAGARGEILISTPVMPINHCYLAPFNKDGISDGSIIDEEGIRWQRPRDIAECVRLRDGSFSFAVLGRADDCVKKSGKLYYLFDLKEQISDMDGILECEVLTAGAKVNELITVHLVPNISDEEHEEKIAEKILKDFPAADGVKFYKAFGINATSGKCDREAMSKETQGFYIMRNGCVSKGDLKIYQEEGQKDDGQ